MILTLEKVPILCYSCHNFKPKLTKNLSKTGGCFMNY